MAQSKSIGKRVLLFPLPYQGHINPMLELAAVLFSRGFSITIFHTTVNSIDSSKYPLYRFVSVSEDGVSSRFLSIDIPLAILRLNKSCDADFRVRLAEILSETDEESVACLITDMHWFRMQAVAKEFDVPTLVLRTGTAASLNGFVAYPLLREKGYLPVQESQLDLPVAELPPLRVRDLLRCGDSSLDVMLELIAEDLVAIKFSHGLILNTFNAIESVDLAKIQQELSIPMFAVGPLHKFTPPDQSSLLTQDRSCLDWLDKQSIESVLYVSFGSLACMSYDEFVETAWGLANSGQPFLLVVRPGSVSNMYQIELPEGFDHEIRDRGMIVEWVPQQEVLAHRSVGGFWTHCGWNSTLEGISEGVPMICRPYFADQMGNARYVTHVWNVGIALENRLEREEIGRTVRRLMREKEGDEIRERMKDLKNIAAHCIEREGSSYLALDKLINLILTLEVSNK